MSIELNRAGFEHAKQLISEDRIDDDKHGDWEELNPDATAQNAFIEDNGYEAYGLWHLGIDPNYSTDTKEAYSFPYGDYKDVVRAGVIAAEERASQYGYVDIQEAARQLEELID